MSEWWRKCLSSLPAVSGTRMKRMCPCTPGLSITELTRSRLLCKWNLRLSVTWKKTTHKTNKHTHEFVEILLWGRYVPKNAEALSIKNKTPHGYTIVPSWGHLQMQTRQILGERLTFPPKKSVFLQDLLVGPRKTEKS